MFYARKLLIGGMRAFVLYEALINTVLNLDYFKKYEEAKVAREKCYIVVSEERRPDDPLVVSAATYMIRILKITWVYEAERYASIYYISLTESIGNESPEIGCPKHNLDIVTFKLILRQVELGHEDEIRELGEAKILICKSLFIFQSFYSYGHSFTIQSIETLVDILRFRRNRADEARNLLKRFSSINKRRIESATWWNTIIETANINIYITVTKCDK